MKKLLHVFTAVGICIAMAFMHTMTLAETRPAAKDIANSAIIIGTYLIDFAALNEEIQTIAQKSANTNSSEKAQSKIYYKSDLNKGVWYDITDAESINDITLTSKKIVSNAVIDALTLEYYAKADGSVISFLTGNAVPAYQIATPENPRNMDEVQSLIKELEILYSLKESVEKEGEEDGDKEEQYNAYLAEIYALNVILAPVADNEVNKYNKTLAGMENSIKKLTTVSGIDTAVSLKLEQKALKAIHCYEVVIERAGDRSGALSEHNKLLHSDMVSKLGDAISELTGKLSELEGEIGAGDDSLISNKENELKQEVIDALENDDVQKAEKALDKLASFSSMVTGESMDDESALSLYEEMFTDAIDSIEDDINSIADRTNDFYTDDEAELSEEAVSDSLKAKIDDANQILDSIYAIDKDGVKKAERLSELAEALSAMKDVTPADDLQKNVKALVTGKADEAAADSAIALALSDDTLAVLLGGIGELEGMRDNAHDRYLGALENGDEDLANQYKQELDNAVARLEDLRAEPLSKVSSAVADIYKAQEDLITATAGKSDALKEKIAKSKAELSACAAALDDMDKMLLDNLEAAIADFVDTITHAETSNTLETQLNTINDAMDNMDDALLDSDAKLTLTDYLAALASDCKKTASDNGNSDKADVIDNLLSVCEAMKQQIKDNSPEEQQKKLDNAVKESKEAISSGDIEKINDSYNDVLTNLAGADTDSKVETLKDIIDELNKAAETAETNGNTAKANALKEIVDKCTDDIEKALKNQALILPAEVEAAISSLKNAINANDLKSLSGEYAELIDELLDTDRNVLNNENKAAVLQDISDALTAAEDKAVSDGNSGVAAIMGALNDICAQDIAKALKGQLHTPAEVDLTDVTSIIGDSSASGIAGDLYGYDFIVEEYNIRLTNSVREVNNVKCIPIIEIARQANSNVVFDGKVHVIKDELILIEFVLGETCAYIGDKKVILSAAPYVDSTTSYIYAPVELFAKGYGLTENETDGLIYCFAA